MKKEKLKQKIVKFVKTHPGSATFTNIQNAIKQHINVYGEEVISAPNDPNLILWEGMSKEFAQLMVELMNEGRVYPHLTDRLAYVHDGSTLDLPLAKRPPKSGYKNPHWVPVTFKVSPPKREKGKQR